MTKRNDIQQTPQPLLGGRLMKLMRLMRLMRLIGLMGLIGLIGCSKDAEDSVYSEAGAVVEVMGYVSGFDEVDEGTRAYEGRTNRAWIPPSGYFIEPSMADLPISIFFTQTSGEPEGGYEEEFFFKRNDKWYVSKNLKQETYYLYGYIPHDNSITASVSTLPVEDEITKTFADGAVLTLANMPTVTTSDFCVVVGAKNGKDYYKANEDYTVTGLKTGLFTYEAEPTEADGETPKGENYVFLLFDHLYSAIRFRIKVHGTYDELRTIKLKGLSLQAFTGEDGEVPTPRKMNAIITLKGNTDGNSPISDITFVASGTEVGKGDFHENPAGEELGTDFKTFQGHFISYINEINGEGEKIKKGVTHLRLTSKYDVYDKKGNLIRKDCEATNKLNLTELFSGQESARPGCRYTINLTIQPTYLYMLSEPDLDNPTVKVE